MPAYIFTVMGIFFHAQIQHKKRLTQILIRNATNL